MKRSLIIFAKEPRGELVKTRLKACLSRNQRINLYKAFLKDTLDSAKLADCEEKILAYDANGGSPGYLKNNSRSFKLVGQEGDGLGERMYNAFESRRVKKASKMVLAGSDIPTLTATRINQAFDLLETSDLVLGPTCDGGYYLIGIKDPHPGLFQGIKWSSGQVLKKTLEKAKQLNLKTVLLSKLPDVDDPAGLRRLKSVLRKEKDRNVALWTRRFLKI